MQKGGKTAMGDVLVSDHIPKVKVRFYLCYSCWDGSKNCTPQKASQTWREQHHQECSYNAWQYPGSRMEQTLPIITAVAATLSVTHGACPQDFFQKDCWKHHPKPYQEFVDWRLKEDAKIESYRNHSGPSASM